MKHSEIFSALEERRPRNPEQAMETVRQLCGTNHSQHSNCHGSGASHVGPCSGSVRHTCTGGAMNIGGSCRQNLCGPTSSYYTPGPCGQLSINKEPSGA
ncbi:MAG: hypothetical protein RDU89_08810 [bacterium]|nr:hypothetical protein [bacterium]